MTFKARRRGWRISRWNQFSPMVRVLMDYAPSQKIEYQTRVVRPARQRSETQRKGGRDEGLRRTEGGKKRAWAWASPGKEGCIGWHGDGHL